MDKITVTKFKIKFLYAVGNILDPDPEGIRIRKGSGFISLWILILILYRISYFAVLRGHFAFLEPDSVSVGAGYGSRKTIQDIDQKIKRNIMS